MHCPVHGHQEVYNAASCPECLEATGQVNIDCEAHGVQVVKPGEGCGFCAALPSDVRQIQ